MEDASDNFPQQKKLENLSSKLRRKFATNFAENFTNFTLEIAGAYKSWLPFCVAFRPSHPEKLDFGPFRLRLAPFRLRLTPFGSVSGPFRVCFGSVSGCWVGSGRGAFVREKNITNLLFPPPGNRGQNVTRNGGPPFGARLILSESWGAPTFPPRNSGGDPLEKPRVFRGFLP